MRTAMIGGSFNPPHWGHLQLAEEVRHAGYERIIFVPSHISAHKKEIERPSPEERLYMVNLAAVYLDALVDDCEIKRGGVSYTIDTVNYLSEKYNIEGKLAVVIGDDLLEGYDTWKRADELANTVDFIVAHRKFRAEQPFSYTHKYLQNVVFPISSTQIRELKRAGGVYRFLVPMEIFQYIEEHNFYE